MHYHIYCNSKAFGVNYYNAVSEFTKRLSSYCDTTLHMQNNLQLAREITVNNHMIYQIVPGPSSYSSEEFAKEIHLLQQSGKSNIHILIGFSEAECFHALSQLTDYIQPSRFSITKCNLPTDTLTLLFYEQLYRGYTILQGKTYHK